jgi:hypothetical protein
VEKENGNVSPFSEPESLDRLQSHSKDNQSLYENEDSSFLYQQFLERFQLFGNLIEDAFGCETDVYIHARGRQTSDRSVEASQDDQKLLRIERQDPVSRSVDDLARLLQRRKFIVRPVYQRSEVINKTKSSAIIESMLLGIKLPPLFIYERSDGTQEIVDGQQRLLSILGYVGQGFKDERGREMRSNKDGFALAGLRILDELNGKAFGD